MKTCCVVNVGVILSTLVATLVHTTAITRDIPGCENNMPYQLKPEWCFNPENKVGPPGPAQVVGSSLRRCAGQANRAVAAQGRGMRGTASEWDPLGTSTLLLADPDQRAGLHVRHLLPRGVLHGGGSPGLRLRCHQAAQLHVHGEGNQGHRLSVGDGQRYPPPSFL